MNIFITTMEDVLVTNDFIKCIINRRKDDIVGLAVSERGQFSSSKKKRDLRYLIAMLIISGPLASLQSMWSVAKFKSIKFFSKYFRSIGSPSILNYAKKNGIRVWKIPTVSNSKFLEDLKAIKPDIIINQAQETLTKEILDIPNICVLNRHNSLLPSYRGRLAPFWALYNNEKETGVTIHLVDEKMDKGAILVQRKVQIEENDNYVSLTRKCYEVAKVAMIDALDIIENNGLEKSLKYPEGKESYFSFPSIKNALRYRRKKLFAGY